MKNFDEPNLDDEAPQDLVPASRLHVEIIGDPARITEQFRTAGLTSLGATEQLRESLRLESAESLKRLRGSLATTSLESFKGAREAVAKAAIADLREISLPKIDMRDHMLPRVEPLKIDVPKLPPPVVPEDIAAVADAVNRGIDAAEAQTQAIVALHSAVEGLAARSEELAEAQAKRADNRDAWLIWLTVPLVLYAFVDLFLR